MEWFEKALLIVYCVCNLFFIPVSIGFIIDTIHLIKNKKGKKEIKETLLFIICFLAVSAMIITVIVVLLTEKL